MNDVAPLPAAGFCVIYRFRVYPEKEAQFIAGWSRITLGIRDHRGGLGSRLHRADDGLWVAYAQWPSRADWERAGNMEAPVDAEAARLMADAIEERCEPILLEPVQDLLMACAAKARG